MMLIPRSSADPSSERTGLLCLSAQVCKVVVENRDGRDYAVEGYFLPDGGAVAMLEPKVIRND